MNDDRSVQDRNRELHEEAERLSEELHTAYTGALLIIAIRESEQNHEQLLALLHDLLNSITDHEGV